MTFFLRNAYFTSYHTFVINEYFVSNFDLTFAVYLAITFHYDVLKGLFDSRCCCWCEESAVIIERKPQFESGKDIYLSLYLDLLISNNFSSMTFFCAMRILQVIGRQSIRQSTNFLLNFWHN